MMNTFFKKGSHGEKYLQELSTPNQAKNTSCSSKVSDKKETNIETKCTDQT